MTDETQNQAEFFADKLMDLANFAVTALIFGQLVGGQIRLWPLFLGLGLFFGLAMLCYFLKKKRKQG